MTTKTQNDDIPDTAADFDDRVRRIAALGEPVRRRLYRFVAAGDGSVSRDEAASGADVPRHVAKFHLDKLVDDGLLAVEYARPPGRRGPGAGRPTKRYRRSAAEVAVSLPQREYELAGKLLVAAVAAAGEDGVDVGEALAAVALRRGQALGRAARDQAGPRASRAAALTALEGVLADSGYEPRREGATLTMANCPFHALAQENAELVCGMNFDLMRGVVEGLNRSDVTARLAPSPGHCCVRIEKPARASKTDHQPKETR